MKSQRFLFAPESTVILAMMLSTSAAAMDAIGPDASRVVAVNDAPTLSSDDVKSESIVQQQESRYAAFEGQPSALAAYLNNWSARVHAAQSSQPHWMTPLVTVTPRLEQEFRYDQYWEQLPNAGHLHVYDSGKGLELIPTETNEVLINAPPYQERSVKKPAEGFNDWPVLTVKQRLASADEEHGNYILTAFVGVQTPRGVNAFTNNAWVITPTLAGGIGFGDFDIQATIGAPLPMRLASSIGFSITGNTALQYHLLTYFWPEFEVNATRWLDGQRQGKTQVYLTPGLILGRFPLFDNHVRAVIGAGYQYAVAPKQVTEPANTPAYGHAWIGTARLAF
jgi:hypothetical protein